MRFHLEIETSDRRIAFELLGNKTIGPGVKAQVPGGTLVLESMHMRKALNVPELLQFIVDISKDIDLALFATWLYDKVKEKPIERITINRREITEISADTIRNVVEEEIKRE